MRLIIEERRAGEPDREEALLASHADAIGVPVVRMTWKPFLRHKVQPEPGDIVAGSVAFVRAALQALGKQLPPPDPYPEPLRPWLYRHVATYSSLGAILDEPAAWPVFIKPAKRWKLFTGFVLDSPNPPQVYAVSRREPVWVSETVNFLSEWRCYVIRGSVAFCGLSDHGGDRNHEVDMERIRIALSRYENAPAAYAIDFGVLSTGETALIEVNDGFGVGAYDGIPAATYFQFVATRWKELARESNDYL